MSLLFDLGRKPPTTKTIALQVREHGADSLDQAQLRADAARYQEVTCRSALNPVKGMPFNWTLNPYRGCTNGCPQPLPRAPLRHTSGWGQAPISRRSSS